MAKGVPIRLTPERIAWLRKHRPRMGQTELARAWSDRFKEPITAHTISAIARRLGIHATKTGLFAPGDKPWNKGKKGYKAGGRSAETRFGPGVRPHTTLPVGSYVKATIAGRNGSYWLLKVSDRANRKAANARLRDWRYVHRLTWEAAHGPIPSGMVVVFLDGDADNCLDVENLACVTRAELARLNQLGWQTLAPNRDLRRAAIAAVRLHQAAHDRANQIGLTTAEKKRALPTVGTFAPMSDDARARLSASQRKAGDPPRGQRAQPQETT